MHFISTRLIWLVVLAGLFVIPFLLPNFRVFQINLMIVYAIAVLGLNLLTGYAGQISLGHGAFYAIGAYVAAVLMEHAGFSAYATLPVAAVVCFGAGVLMGFPALRLGGHYLALATFALALAVPQLLKYKGIAEYTGGVQGIVLSKPNPPFEFRFLGAPLTEDRWLFFVTIAVALPLFLLASNLIKGRIGRAIVAIRDQPIAAGALGVNLAWVKTLTFGLSAAYTGIAGALGAVVIAFVAPDSFTSFLSISLLVGVVVGGLGSIWGALFGAAFIQFVPNIADEISKSAPWAVYGAILIVLIYVAPGGVMGAFKKLKSGDAK